MDGCGNSTTILSLIYHRLAILSHGPYIRSWPSAGSPTLKDARSRAEFPTMPTVFSVGWNISLVNVE